MSDNATKFGSPWFESNGVLRLRPQAWRGGSDLATRFGALGKRNKDSGEIRFSPQPWRGAEPGYATQNGSTAYDGDRPMTRPQPWRGKRIKRRDEASTEEPEEIDTTVYEVVIEVRQNPRVVDNINVGPTAPANFDFFGGSFFVTEATPTVPPFPYFPYAFDSLNVPPFPINDYGTMEMRILSSTPALKKNIQVDMQQALQTYPGAVLTGTYLSGVFTLPKSGAWSAGILFQPAVGQETDGVPNNIASISLV